MEVTFMTDGRDPEKSSVLGFLFGNLSKRLQNVTSPQQFPSKTNTNKHFPFGTSQLASGISRPYDILYSLG